MAQNVRPVSSCILVYCMYVFANLYAYYFVRETELCVCVSETWRFIKIFLFVYEDELFMHKHV